jgi:hypothetical protein
MYFHKPCLVKGMIQSGAEADAQRSFAALVDALQRHVSATGSSPSQLAAALPPSPLFPLSQGALCSPKPAGSVEQGAGWSRFAGGCGALTGGRTWGARDALLAGCLVALCVLTAVVWRVGAAVSADLRELAAAIRGATAAGCPPGGDIFEQQGALGV